MDFNDNLELWWWPKLAGMTLFAEKENYKKQRDWKLNSAAKALFQGAHSRVYFSYMPA